MKSAKCLNHKLVKKQLTKKRRQVGCGGKIYTITYTKHNEETFFTFNYESKVLYFTGLNNALNKNTVAATAIPIDSFENLKKYTSNYSNNKNWKTPDTGLITFTKDGKLQLYIYKKYKGIGPSCYKVDKDKDNNYSPGVS